MHLARFTSIFLLLLASLLLVHAVEDSQQITSPELAEDAPNKPKLMKPRKGFYKEEHEVDSGDQRARAKDAILENAEDNQPESERVIDSMDDLRYIIR